MVFPRRGRPVELFKGVSAVESVTPLVSSAVSAAGSAFRDRFGVGVISSS